MTRSAFMLACTPLLLAGTAMAGDFEDPVVVTAGDKAFDTYIYPTPVLQDVDNDGVRELIVGDLIGNLFVCKAGEGSDVAWQAAANMQAQGKNLKLNNW